MPKNNSAPQRDYRRTQAKARQAERDQREDSVQLELLDTRPGFSNKESARLRGVGTQPSKVPRKRVREVK